MKKKLLVMALLSFVILTPNVRAEELDFCVQTAAIWQLVGYALFALKVIIPIIIIVLGTVDFAKAVINEKDDDLSSAARTLIRRILIGVFIFFIPTIVSVIFNRVATASEAVEAGKACNDCIVAPKSDACINYKGTAKTYRQN